jgi:hypothetical protein
MAETEMDERIDVDSLDAKTMDEIKSKLARALALASKEQGSTLRGHVRLGHIEAGFSKTGSIQIVIGGHPGGTTPPAGSSGG